MQPTRPTCCSCAVQSFGTLKNRVIIAGTTPVAASLPASPELREGGCEANPECRKSRGESAARRAAATALVCDRSSGACGSDLGDVFIFLRRVATDADRADDFVFEHDRNATLQRRRSGQSQSSYATVADLIFKYFAGPAENCRGARLADSNLNAGDLRVVESLQEQHMTAVVHNDNYNGGATLFCFGLRRGRDFLCSVEREHFFHGQIRFDR